MKYFSTLIIILCLVAVTTGFAVERWCPTQKAPEAFIRAISPGKFEKVISPDGKSTSGIGGATHFMVQSLSGIAAGAVNEEKLDELVWVPDKRPTYSKWLNVTKKQLGLEDRGIYKPWQIVKRYKDKGLIKGYILYSYSYRGAEDISVNVATSLCGIYDAILIEEGQQEKAEKMGLEMLLDARGKSYKWCFDNYRDKLSKELLLTIHPKLPYSREIAIAHKCMTVYETKDPVEEIMEWMNPLSPVMGWNTGGEDKFTGQASRNGHLITASASTANLPLLSCVSGKYEPEKLKSVDPAKINYGEGEHFASFLMSDGDNFRWSIGTFVTSKYYWNSPDHGKFPIGWTGCTANLYQMCPPALDHFARTQPEDSEMVVQGGGYYYPDNFAVKRPNRKELLARHAGNVGDYLEMTGVDVFSFICMDVDNEKAMEAYEIFAREMDGLAGMIALQYYPYDGGDGEVFWFENSDGIEIPVVCVKYSLWSNATWPRGGTPKKISRLINEQAEKNKKKRKKSFSVTSVHAWSSFKEVPRGDEQAENAPRGYSDHVGVEPVKWCIYRLDDKVKVVTPAELIWRLRMEHDPEVTKKVIKNYK